MARLIAIWKYFVKQTVKLKHSDVTANLTYLILLKIEPLPQYDTGASKNP